MASPLLTCLSRRGVRGSWRRLARVSTLSCGGGWGVVRVGSLRSPTPSLPIVPYNVYGFTVEPCARRVHQTPRQRHAPRHTTMHQAQQRSTGTKVLLLATALHGRFAESSVEGSKLWGNKDWCSQTVKVQGTRVTVTGAGRRLSAVGASCETPRRGVDRHRASWRRARRRGCRRPIPRRTAARGTSRHLGM